MSVHQSKANAITSQLLIATILVAGITTYVSIHNVSTRTKAGSQNKEVSVLFVPAQQQGASGETVSLTPFLIAKENKPGFLVLSFAYDASTLSFVGTDETNLASTIELVTPAEDIGTAIQMTYAVKDAGITPDETIQLSKLSFIVREASPSAIRVDVPNSEVVLLDSQDGVLLAGEAIIN